MNTITEPLTYQSGPICLDEFVSVLAQYPANVRWNGWLCPAIDASGVQAVIEAFPGDEYMTLEWEPETGVLILTQNDGYEVYVERIEPDEDGLYSLGAYGWTWSEDPQFYDSAEHKAWARARMSVHCAASNWNNHMLPADTPLRERFALNQEVGDAVAFQWEQSNPEPPKEQA